MTYEILYECKAKQNIRCYVCKANLEDYVSSLKPDFYEFEVQRGIVRNSYLDTLRNTISNNEMIPPITLVVSKKPIVKDRILDVEDKSTDILDGLQRTVRLWVYKQINDIVKDKGISSFADLVDALKSDDMGIRIIDLYFVNAKFLRDFLLNAEGVSTIQSFINGWKEYNLLFYIWYGLNDKQIVRKMLELNAGQKAVSSTHQYELLYLHFFNNDKIKIPDDMQLVRVKDKEYQNIRRGRNKQGQFLQSSVIIAYQSFIQRKPLRVQAVNEVRMDEDNENDIEQFFSPENLTIFLQCMYLIDNVFCMTDSKHIAWYGKDTTLSGVYAALGDFVCSNDIGLRLQKLKKIAVHDIRKLHFNVDKFEMAYSKLSSTNVNVGNAVRKAIFKYTLNVLQNKQISWYECLMNKESEL